MTAASLLLIVLVAGCFTRAPVSNQPKYIGIVIDASGEPNVVRRNENYLIGVESRIYEGDILETGDNSRARIRMIDHTIIRLGNDCHVLVHRYDYAPGMSKPSARITFTNGAMQINAGEISRARKGSFRVETPFANLALHDAVFWGGFAANTLDVAMLKGRRIDIANEHGSVMLDHAGDGTTVIAGGAPQVPTHWTPAKLAQIAHATSI